jgi:hypothetical protein
MCVSIVTEWKIYTYDLCSFKILTVVDMEITLLGDMAPYSAVGGYEFFGEMCCFHLYGIISEDELTR